jgi:hypothetical protein
VPKLASPTNWPLSGILRALWLKITGLSGAPTSNDRLHQRSTATAVCSGRRLETVYDVRSHRTVRCTTRIGKFNGQLLQTPTVGWCGVHRTVNSAVSDAHRTVRCARWQRTQPTTRMLVGAINIPQPQPFKSSNLSLSTLNTRAKNTLQIHIQTLQSSPSAIMWRNHLDYSSLSALVSPLGQWPTLKTE